MLPEKSTCCKINHTEGTSSMNLKIGANVKDTVGANLIACDKVAVTVKLGKLFHDEIPDESFMFALNKRYHTITYFRILLHIRPDGHNSFEYKFGIHTLKTISN